MAADPPPLGSAASESSTYCGDVDMGTPAPAAAPAAPVEAEAEAPPPPPDPAGAPPEEDALPPPPPPPDPAGAPPEEDAPPPPQPAEQPPPAAAAPAGGAGGASDDTPAEAAAPPVAAQPPPPVPAPAAGGVAWAGTRWALHDLESAMRAAGEVEAEAALGGLRLRCVTEAGDVEQRSLSAGERSRRGVIAGAEDVNWRWVLRASQIWLTEEEKGGRLRSCVEPALRDLIEAAAQRHRRQRRRERKLERLRALYTQECCRSGLAAERSRWQSQRDWADFCDSLRSRHALRQEQRRRGEIEGRYAELAEVEDRLREPHRLAAAAGAPPHAVTLHQALLATQRRAHQDAAQHTVPEDYPYYDAFLEHPTVESLREAHAAELQPTSTQRSELLYEGYGFLRRSPAALLRESPERSLSPPRPGDPWTPVPAPPRPALGR